MRCILRSGYERAAPPSALPPGACLRRRCGSRHRRRGGQFGRLGDAAAVPVAGRCAAPGAHRRSRRRRDGRRHLHQLTAAEWRLRGQLSVACRRQRARVGHGKRPGAPGVAVQQRRYGDLLRQRHALLLRPPQRRHPLPGRAPQPHRAAGRARDARAAERRRDPAGHRSPHAAHVGLRCGPGGRRRTAGLRGAGVAQSRRRSVRRRRAVVGCRPRSSAAGRCLRGQRQQPRTAAECHEHQLWTG